MIADIPAGLFAHNSELWDVYKAQFIMVDAGSLVGLCLCRGFSKTRNLKVLPAELFFHNPKLNSGTGTVVGNKLLVVDGRDVDQNTLNLAECFDLKAQTWSSAPSMATKRVGYAAAVLRYWCMLPKQLCPFDP